MLTGRVLGTATATVKHESLKGWKLVVVQPLLIDGKPDGEPVLAIDSMGAGAGSDVLLTSEGGAVRDIMKRKDSPVRWMVLGICDA